MHHTEHGISKQLLWGQALAILMQLVDFALPRDAFIAGTLSRAPESWTLSLDDAMKKRLSAYDVKAEVAVALEKRHASVKDVYSQSFWCGSGVIVFSVLGLLREGKINRMRKIIEQATD